MTAAIQRGRARPGVTFEVDRVTRAPALPRMDVTGFVGFASNGPFDTPVMIEDVARFREIFGADVTLGAAASGVDRTQSLLGPTVELFFENGGTTCWVVRVGDAAEAATPTYTIPGLVAGTLSDPDTWTPAAAQGRAPGTGGESIRLAGAVQRQRLAARSAGAVITADGGRFEVPRRSTVQPGDLLELEFVDGLLLWVPVAGVAEPEGVANREISWSRFEECWLRRTAAFDRLTERGDTVPAVTLSGAAIALTELAVAGDSSLTGRGHADLGDGRVGQLLRFELDGDPCVAVLAADPVVGPDGSARIDAWPTRTLNQARPLPGSVGLSRVAVLRVALHARRGERALPTLTGLDLVPGASRWAGLLPDDADLFGRRWLEAGGFEPRDVAGPDADTLDEAVAHPRFPAAFNAEPEATFIPLGLDVRPHRFGTMTTADTPAHARDGLSSFSAAAFGDAELNTMDPRAMARRAKQRMVEGESLTGLHALFPLEDVAVVAAPDAAQPAWAERSVDPPPSPVPPVLTVDDTRDVLAWTTPGADAADPGLHSHLVEACEWPDFESPTSATIVSHERLLEDGRAFEPDVSWCGWRWFRVRERVAEVPGPWSNTVALWGGQSDFAPCELSSVAALDLSVVDVPASGATRAHALVSAVGVNAAAVGPATVEFQVSKASGFEGGITTTLVPNDPASPGLEPALAVVFTNAPQFVRARLLPDGEVRRPWSATMVARAIGTSAIVAEPVAEGVAASALALHQTLARFAAARHDLTVLVSFPRTYEPDQIDDHLGELTSSAERSGSAPGLSTWGDFLHAHHPWVIRRDGTQSAVPADGAIAGQLAAMARSRGAWIAGAPKPLAGVVGLERRLASDTHNLFRLLQVNALETQLGDQLVIGVDTLSRGEATRPVTVRRLLSLLRRLAVREGRRLVFENNGPGLWGLAQTRFDTALNELWTRGAFAGATRAEGFRVVSDASVNPQTAIDNGQLVIELLVAPSHPLEYLIVRLGQLGSAGFAEVESP